MNEVIGRSEPSESQRQVAAQERANDIANRTAKRAELIAVAALFLSLAAWLFPRH